MIRRFEDYEGNRVACALRHASKAYWAIYDAAVSLSKRKLAAGLRSGYGIKPLCEFTGLPPIDVRDWVPTFREIVTELKYLSEHTDYGDLYETQEDIWWLCQFICEYERVKAQAAQSVGKKQTAKAFLNISKLVEPLCGREEVTISKKGEPRIWEYRYSFCDEKNKATWFDTLLTAIEWDTEATAELNGENKASHVLDLIGELKPDETKHDAREYCARVLLHVWNMGGHGGKRQSAKYVFGEAKRGVRLSDDIHYARTLQKKWGLATGGIMVRAAEYHAAQSCGKHKKSDGMEHPETMRQAAKKSRIDELKNKDAEGKRRSGRKR